MQFEPHLIRTVYNVVLKEEKFSTRIAYGCLIK